jgi:hypothetical protein
MDRWDSDADDWRGWKDGKYDNRYKGTDRHKKYRSPYIKMHYLPITDLFVLYSYRRETDKHS